MSFLKECLSVYFKAQIGKFVIGLAFVVIILILTNL
jgi:hypothetical protein